MAEEMVVVLPDSNISADRFSVNSSGGVKYFYCKALKKQHLRFFTKTVNAEKHGPVTIPADYEIVENKRTKLPIARPKKK